jgi:hypothetical protein
MSNTTAKRMNLHLEKPDDKYDFRLSRGLKNKAKELAEAQNMDMADYTRLALSEKVDSDSVVLV